MVSIYLRLRDFGDGRGINNARTDRLVQEIENDKYDKFQNVTELRRSYCPNCEFKQSELPKNANLRARNISVRYAAQRGSPTQKIKFTRRAHNLISNEGPKYRRDEDKFICNEDRGQSSCKTCSHHVTYMGCDIARYNIARIANG
jgi:Zn finger protein HypA/HybF involved in hydrogenase expression